MHESCRDVELKLGLAPGLLIDYHAAVDSSLMIAPPTGLAGGSVSQRVAEILLRRQWVAMDEMQRALDHATETNERIGRVLVDRGLATDAQVALAFGEFLRLPVIQLSRFTPDPVLVDTISGDLRSKHALLPIARTGQTLVVAVGDPLDVDGLEELRSSSGLEVVPVVAPEREVQEALQRFSQYASEGLEDILKDVEEGDVEVSSGPVAELALEEMLESAEEAPVIRIVNSIMIEAIRRRASDIHLEPMEKTLRLRYRIDGVLHENPSPPRSLLAAMVSRIKILANLDIAERRVPQDGRFKIRALGKECDIRVSILPVVHGEKVVMRVLDQSNLAPNLEALGLEPTAYRKIEFAIGQPHGMLLVTGPTGSGKTTTLYSALQEINRPGVNIITVEDPVEYQLRGINQVQVLADVGLTFASGLRSILRQDPDIVMVGEIRDGETASIAVQAALTGHLVLSTLHTNDAPGAITRLGYMGIEPFLISSSVLMAQAQRLLRKLCPSCKREIRVAEDQLRANHIDPAALADVRLFGPRGCAKCNNTGYLGRNALMEILLMSDRIREMILARADAAQIRAQAITEGMATLRDAGLGRLRDGVTSLEEVLRVTGAE